MYGKAGQLTEKIFAHKKIVTIVLLSIVAVSSLSVSAYADDGTLTSVESIALLGAFIVGGIWWSLAGYINNIRTHDNWIKANKDKKPDDDPNWKGFEPRKMRDDVFIGLAVGFGAFMTSLMAGQLIHVPQITDGGSFVGAVIFAFGAIGATDKTVVGAVLNS